MNEFLGSILWGKRLKVTKLNSLILEAIKATSVLSESDLDYVPVTKGIYFYFIIIFCVSVFK